MPTLNDSRMLVRLVAFGMCLALGLIVGGFLASLRDAGAQRTLVLLLGGLAVEIVVCIAMVYVSRRGDARIRTEVESSTRELVGGTMPPAAPVPARVVRSRRERRRTAGVIESPTRPFGRLERAGRIVVLTVLPADAPPRRVGMLVPQPAAGALTEGTVHLVHLHPGHSEAGVLNVRAAPGALDAARHDPRWGSAELPSERAVAGGITMAFGAAAFGVATGLCAALLITG